MKKLFKIISLLFVFITAIIVVTAIVSSEELPKGIEGQRAEELTDKIQKAIHQEAWDTTVAIRWSFMGYREYIWDKKRNFVQATWTDMNVIFNTKTGKGIAYEDGELLDEEDTYEAICTATDNFNNDSFWLIAPYKLRDPDTKRSVVYIDDEEALKITYYAGGSTPGDSYVWLVDRNYTPKKWKLWVSIIPIGGFETGWNDWITYPTGVRIANLHEGLFDIKIENIHTGMSVKEINDGIDPFERANL